MTSRFLRSTLAVGTLLVVCFVHPFADVRAKTANFSHFVAIGVQRDDSNASNGRGVETDFGVDASSAKSSGFNVSSNSTNDADRRNGDGSSDAVWFRLDRDKRGVPTRLSTSIVRFEGTFRTADGSARPVSIDLIGAIHFAERDYYERLNAEFKNYETVVFELIAEKGFDAKDLAVVKAKKAEKNDASLLGALSFFQQKLGDALGFVYQIDGVDYSAPNFKRGDADADDFLVRLTTGDDLPDFFAGSAFDSLLASNAGRFEGWALACALAKDKRLALRRLVADELARTELVVDPDAKETALIHFRNKIAINVAKKEIEAGKSKIAVFYGAAHLDDLARRIEATLEAPRRAEPRWIPAWTMEAAAK